jgi:hypothetical protein
MAKKPLPSPDELRQLLEYDPSTGVLRWRHRPLEMFGAVRSYRSWNTKHAGKPALATLSNEGYFAGTVAGRAVQAHRVAWAMYYGEWPGLIDHINRVRIDNRIANLRDVSKRDNARNMGRSNANTSGCTGVAWCNRNSKWAAYIRDDTAQRHLGYTYFYCEAVKRRKAAERRIGYSVLHGT